MDVYHIDRPLKESIMERLRKNSYESLASVLEDHWCEIKPKIMYIVDKQYGDIDLNFIKKGLSMRCKVLGPLNKSKFITELDLFYRYKNDQGKFTHCLMFDNVFCK